MKVSYEKKIGIFFMLLLAVCITFIVVAEAYFHNSLFTLLCGAFSFAVLVLLCGFVFATKRYTNAILIKLSDIISSLIDRNDTPVFSVLEDTLLSKLQAQVIKLAGILQTQNSRLKYERDEIRALISDLSHQLKTPLANLKMYCGFLHDSTLPTVQRTAFINNLQGQLDKLSWLTESMIKMSRLESGIIQLTPKACSADTLILTALKQVYLKAEQKNIELKYIQEGDISIVCDAKWTTEAVFNILDNSVKYTNNGSINITACAYELYARIDIRDTGMGIAEQEINHIFRRFYRGKNVRGIDGVGIGLYITREIIMNQGGYIKVSSKQKEGSTFSVFLPMS